MAESRAVTAPAPPALDPQLVRRPRLVSRLRGARDAPLLLVTAPAGYGKTTTLQQWLADDDRPSAWITLDEADNDPAALVTSLANGFHPKRVMWAVGRAPRLAP